MPRLPGPVFLSHSSHNQDFVRRLGSDLENRGFSVWLDAHDLHGGDALPRRIAEAIAESSAMVVVLSQSALASPWLSYELQIAVTRMISGQLTVIPARLENVPVPAEVSALLYADFYDEPYETGLDTIITALEQLDSSNDWKARDPQSVLEETFDGWTSFSSPEEYNPREYDAVIVDIDDNGDRSATVIYDIERAYGATTETLGESYWRDYVQALDEMPEPYSLIVSERPLEIDLPTVPATRDRVRMFEEPAPDWLGRDYLHTVFVVDISGTDDQDEQRQLLRVIKDLIRERETEYLQILQARRDARAAESESSDRQAGHEPAR